jgi:hypothetical protein
MSTTLAGKRAGACTKDHAELLGLKYMSVDMRYAYLPPLALTYGDEEETLVVRSPMGSGKTRALITCLKGLPPDASVLCVGYRRVLNSALAAAFPLADY